MDWQLIASYFTVKSTDIFYSVREAFIFTFLLLLFPQIFFFD